VVLPVEWSDALAVVERAVWVMVEMVVRGGAAAGEIRDLVLVVVVLGATSGSLVEGRLKWMVDWLRYVRSAAECATERLPAVEGGRDGAGVSHGAGAGESQGPAAGTFRWTDLLWGFGPWDE